MLKVKEEFKNTLKFMRLYISGVAIYTIALHLTANPLYCYAEDSSLKLWQWAISSSKNKGENMKQLKDYKALSVAEKNILERCREAIKAIDLSAEVMLYGSRARGDAGSESDYNLLILTDGEATFKKEDVIRDKVFPIELETDLLFSLNLTSRKDWSTPLYKAMPLYENIKREGVIL
ncbi:MAG: nucleotidyltransferase domain-containing protein [Candidatus Schekmanbacteria bacterium]|nr:nucleotidyltransferase domain-containing protein [Candidatus Schekmanbacteria bacterium]